MRQAVQNQIESIRKGPSHPKNKMVRALIIWSKLPTSTEYAVEMNHTTP